MGAPITTRSQISHQRPTLPLGARRFWECLSPALSPTIANLGTHMAFDATRKLPGEGYHRVWPELVKMPAEIVARVEAMRRNL